MLKGRMRPVATAFRCLCPENHGPGFLLVGAYFSGREVTNANGQGELHPVFGAQLQLRGNHSRLAMAKGLSILLPV